jgi:hypothetical protein
MRLRQKFAEDDCCRHIVKLLKEIAEQQGNAKGKNLFKRIACGHVPCHGKPPLFWGYYTALRKNARRKLPVSRQILR